ncbi:MAG: hypothetical protein ACOYND_03345 [Bacteroidota bacterium]
MKCFYGGIIQITMFITIFSVAISQNEANYRNKIINGVIRPPLVIYKTTRDYSKNIPIIMSEDKKEILSYPDPLDLQANMPNKATPIHLHKGYLLDRRGINKNVAFLRYTYSKYSKLKKPLTISEMYTNIIDSNPLTEFYLCNSLSYQNNIENKINWLIDKNQLKTICE